MRIRKGPRINVRVTLKLSTTLYAVLSFNSQTLYSYAVGELNDTQYSYSRTLHHSKPIVLKTFYFLLKRFSIAILAELVLSVFYNPKLGKSLPFIHFRPVWVAIFLTSSAWVGDNFFTAKG